jgi:hypothetical protein
VKGSIVTNIPNGLETSQLPLTDILYSPDMGCMLVSVGCLDEEGYSAVFENGLCMLQNYAGEVIGTIPRSSHGLYKVTHSEVDESVCAADDSVSIMQLHSRLGHVSPLAARKLLQSGMVTGLRLNTFQTNEAIFCEACVYVKSNRKPVLKERQGERVKTFGDEIHTDVWGPAPTMTIGK